MIVLSAVVSCDDFYSDIVIPDLAPGFKISYTTAIVGGLYLMHSLTGSADTNPPLDEGTL